MPSTKLGADTSNWMIRTWQVFGISVTAHVIYGPYNCQAYLTDEKMRAEASARGEDVTALPKQYCQLINASLASKPSDMIAAVHLCKGNFRSTFFAQGGEEGYAPIAEVMFKEVCVLSGVRASMNMVIFMLYDLCSSTSTHSSWNGRTNVPERTSAF